MARLRWSDEERERLRYTARQQDFTEQGLWPSDQTFSIFLIFQAPAATFQAAAGGLCRMTRPDMVWVVMRETDHVMFLPDRNIFPPPCGETGWRDTLRATGNYPMITSRPATAGTLQTSPLPHTGTQWSSTAGTSQSSTVVGGIQPSFPVIPGGILTFRAVWGTALTCSPYWWRPRPTITPAGPPAPAIIWLWALVLSPTPSWTCRTRAWGATASWWSGGGWGTRVNPTACRRRTWSEQPGQPELTGVSVFLFQQSHCRTVASDNPPFSLQIPNSLRRETRQNRTRHSLPDLFESLNYPPRPDIAPVRSDISTWELRRFYSQGQNTPGGSVTFQSPVVSSTPTTSILPPPPPAPSSSSPSASQTNKEDETLKMLQRHYLQAILTLAPAHKLSVSLVIIQYKFGISLKLNQPIDYTFIIKKLLDGFLHSSKSDL